MKKLIFLTYFQIELKSILLEIRKSTTNYTTLDKNSYLYYQMVCNKKVYLPYQQYSDQHCLAATIETIRIYSSKRTHARVSSRPFRFLNLHFHCCLKTISCIWDRCLNQRLYETGICHRAHWISCLDWRQCSIKMQLPFTSKTNETIR